MNSHGIDGSSPPVVRLREAVSRLAPTRLSILVHGETGTGKERVARGIHAASRRANGPFVAVDCASLPSGLALAELFGHERGAFTGAARQRDGLVAAADGGTLFLDEVGDLPPGAQGALLRTLAEGTVQRLGSLERTSVDVRVVAATSRVLGAEVESGRFRADLHFRLSAATLAVPALRERGDDVVVLAQLLLGPATQEAGRSELVLGEASLGAIRHAPWPGNVRQLSNALRRAAVFAAGDVIQPDDLGLSRDDPGLPTLAEARRSAERAYLESLLTGAGGNVSLAARRAEVHRTELHRLMRRHGLRGGDFRGR